jgi:hypothetical protein
MSDNLPEKKENTSPILQAALNPDLDVEKVEKLFELHVKMENREAVKLFNTAMSEVQSKIGVIVKDGDGEKANTKYAKLETINKTIVPIYTAAGFSMSFDTEKSEAANCMLIKCEVSHSSGHSKSYRYDCPIDNVGAKGTKNKTETHGRGSGISYARRYLTAMIFNLTIAGEDNDGNNPNEIITEEQQIEINHLLQTKEADVDKFLRYVGCRSVETMPMKSYGKAISALRRKQ